MSDLNENNNNWEERPNIIEDPNQNVEIKNEYSNQNNFGINSPIQNNFVISQKVLQNKNQGNYYSNNKNINQNPYIQMKKPTHIKENPTITIQNPQEINNLGQSQSINNLPQDYIHSSKYKIEGNIQVNNPFPITAQSKVFSGEKSEQKNILNQNKINQNFNLDCTQSKYNNPQNQKINKKVSQNNNKNSILDNKLPSKYMKNDYINKIKSKNDNNNNIIGNNCENMFQNNDNKINMNNNPSNNFNMKNNFQNTINSKNQNVNTIKSNDINLSLISDTSSKNNNIYDKNNNPSNNINENNNIKKNNEKINYNKNINQNNDILNFNNNNINQKNFGFIQNNMNINNNQNNFANFQNNMNNNILNNNQNINVDNQNKNKNQKTINKISQQNIINGNPINPSINQINQFQNVPNINNQNIVNNHNNQGDISNNSPNNNNNNINPPIFNNKKEYSFSRYTKAPKTGLQNLGDSSYLNSILQFLGCFRHFSSYFVKPSNAHYFAENVNNSPLTFVIHRLFLHFYPYPEKNEPEIYNPYYILETIKHKNIIYKTNKKRNPNDLISYILNTLHNELNEFKNRNIQNNINFYDKNKVLTQGINNICNSNKSIIYDYFHWYELKEIKCNTCNISIYNCNSFNIFELDLLRTFNYCKRVITIQDCLQYYSTTRQQNLVCEQCKQKTIHSTTTSIFCSPNNFIFSLDRKNLDQNLLSVQFNIEEKINLKNFVSNKNCLTLYQLIGIVSYSTTEKKYVSFCMSPVDSQWYMYSDEIVQLVQLNQVIIFHNNNRKYIPCLLAYKSIKKEKEK